MANVTVLGAGGATVTISLSSADNAAAAQTAVQFVNNLTASKIVDQQTWSGTGTLPASQNLLAGAVISTPGNLGALTAQYVSTAANAAGNVTVIGPQNFKAVAISGDSTNMTYGNQSQAGEVFFGNGSNVLLNFQGHADMTGTDGTYILETDDDATTTVTLAGKATLLTSDLLGNSGANVINVAAGSNATLVASGASTIPATINAVSGSLFVAAFNKGSAVINPGAANVTVVSGLSTGNTNNDNDLGGRVTLFGGSGSATVAFGQGSFTGGTAGKNSMFTSTVAGSATLTGGGEGDFLTAYGSGQLLLAGAGHSTLYAREATGGNTFFVGNGFTTVFGGAQGGNAYVFSGLGAAEVDGRNELAPGTATQNSYFNFDLDNNDATGGTYFIADFVTGVDQLQLRGAETADVKYYAPGAVNSPMGAIGGTQVIVSSGTTYNFFETGTLGQDIFQTDIKNV